MLLDQTGPRAMMTLPMVSAATAPGRLQEMIRATDSEFIEEDFVQLVVVVLAGVDQRRARSIGPADR